MDQIVNSYYENNAKKLHEMADKILRKFGGLSDKDKDDFYSLANEVFVDVMKRYDKKQSFDGFLYSCLSNKFKSEITRLNRKKRQGDRNALSIDASIGEDDSMTIGDTIQSDFNIETILSEKMGEGFSEKTEEYLHSLSDPQQKIAKLIMKGYEAKDIKKMLNLTDEQYRLNWNVMASYEKKRVLYNDNNCVEECKMSDKTVLVEDVAETYKNTSYSIDSISKQLQKKRIRDDHILQRHSGLWPGFAKSELISDVLRGRSLTQIIISEEIKNGLRMQWLIDGKQRCTTLHAFLHDEFPISKNVKNYNITYQTTKTDESGNEVLNEDGFTEVEFREFDIRGKKFSQLPEELQDIFKDRQIPVLYNMNCTKKDIAEDIARFNRSRPMNKAQNGWLGLDECFAEMVDNIAKMPFFQPDFIGSTYTRNTHTSGADRRIIVESIMVSDFIDEYCDFDKMCEFLSEEASDSNFTDFYSMVERLTVVCNEEVAQLFNAKDSFLWFGLFSRFIKSETDDKKFIEFMTEFIQFLHNKKINGVSYDDLNGKSTKDKNVVLGKMEHLEKLMYEFLGVNKDDVVIDDVLTFVKQNVCQDTTPDDIELYEDCLNDLTLNVDNNTKLLDKQNHPSLVSIVTYACENDIYLDEWFTDYFERNKDYIRNQRENYIHMRADLDKYVANSSKKSA